MIIKKSGVKKLEEYYNQAGNQVIVVAGQLSCGKEELFLDFAKDKKLMYYRCRQASANEQLELMKQEIERQFQVKLQKNSYEEYFNRIKTGNPSKLVIVIDEAQYIIKKDPEFMKAIVKLKAKKLYPGPVMVILATSSLTWLRNDMAEEIGESVKKIDGILQVDDLNFLEVVRAFPDFSSVECIQIYGVLGGVPGYLNRWDARLSFKENICNLVLARDGYLFYEAERLVASQLRELSVYNTILGAIASGHNKLNDLFLKTGFSRAKISVYMKNLSQFDIVEKLVSFETGGWENAKKGVYQIKNTFVNFWYKFVYPNLSDLYLMTPEEFYDLHIAGEIDEYLKRYFRNVCMEYLLLLDQMEQLPFQIKKMGTWVGKNGNIDIIAQSTDRRNIVGICNWADEELSVDMCGALFSSMRMAKISSDHYYLFSAKSFAPALIAKSNEDERFTLIDMNEL